MNSKSMFVCKFSLSLVLVFSAGLIAQESPTPLRRAHAHNDYEHDRPCLDALSHGFCSVEADIFLVDGELLVGHDKWSLRAERTLKKLYLDPLLQAVKKNDGRVFKNGPVFTLLIDIKSDGEETYAVLARQLKQYREMLSGLHNGKYEHRAVQAVISGACPRSKIANDRTRLCSIDGRLSDLESKAPAHLLPMISDHWGKNFKWRGKSPISRDVVEKLESIVSKAHASGRRVRFWATPESPVVWDALLKAGVDHVNTDQLELLKEHLLKRNQETNRKRNGKEQPPLPATSNLYPKTSDQDC